MTKSQGNERQWDMVSSGPTQWSRGQLWCTSHTGCRLYFLLFPRSNRISTTVEAIGAMSLANKWTASASLLLSDRLLSTSVRSLSTVIVALGLLLFSTKHAVRWLSFYTTVPYTIWVFYVPIWSILCIAPSVLHRMVSVYWIMSYFHGWKFSWKAGRGSLS